MKSRSLAEQKTRAMRTIVSKALARHDGNRTYAARDLAIDRAYILRLMKRLELTWPRPKK